MAMKSIKKFTQKLIIFLLKNRKVKIYNRNVLRNSIKTNYDLYFLADPLKSYISIMIF